MKYFIILLLVIIGCSTPKTISGKEPTNLIAISPTDTTYTNYFNVQPTTTPDGWDITYWVKNDSTRYTDVYIQWEKGGVKRMYSYPHVLEYRGQFMPQFLAENSNHIFMDHACATDCWAILALPKNNSDKAIDFEGILGYDFNLNQLVCRNYNDDNRLMVTATDLKRHKTKSVIFKNRYYSTDIGYAPLDTIIFEGDRVIIDCGFFNTDGETVRERQTIRF